MKLRKIKNTIITGAMMTVMLSSQSCDSYLDVVPDNVSTIEHAFKLRNEAEKYLFTLYSYLPKDGSVNNIGMLAGDEIWIPYQTSIYSDAFEIARGNQSVSNTYRSSWSNMYQAIRHCNIFLENVNDLTKVRDITEVERRRWIGEAEFLKAYYHFLLLQMYGPIPLIKTNLDIDATKEEVAVPRNSVDECVDYIVELLDASADKLPLLITDRTLELGRLTRPIAKAVKAKVLITAASPLYNGNPDYADYQNKDGEALFNSTFEISKWEIAATAAKEAVLLAEEAGHMLFKMPATPFSLSDTTILQLDLRQAVCERWNPEHLWANPNSTTTDLQLQAMAPLHLDHNHNNARKILSPPLKIARQFYTRNGVPINEDKTLSFTDDTQLRTAIRQERFYIEEGFQTARLHFDREPRFYSSLAFDGSTWYKYDSPGNSDVNTFIVRSKRTDYGGSTHAFHFNVTGYFIKKLVDWNQSMSASGASYRSYPWPQIRLADLYLLYTEAVNEAYGPDHADAFTYINKVRERAGLKGVEESWTNYSTNASKFSSKEGFREIIRQERLIELAFEGHRFWDIRRWKKAAEYMNSAITGWNMQGENAISYYQINTLYQQRFITPRDYFWPLSENAVIQNKNLVQSPGW
ncbi:RagB/SusD family nutrient uptake outer membrane protein [Sphingobacterium olei]|uniref:RagB/SusD family nutrient uptake outer membrane protein n=1 Tax=Sphingobacterium olei TaxID=2571155 RepID=A0A4U0P001_9SPHI|nr:RagB/SusD family nutrient uptake outer membrane protein [Sphingobacterium olei]TJZ60496.1 RagB/SusD family nutrient uptake outer membrane protein [Sphingobacterium olei]